MKDEYEQIMSQHQVNYDDIVKLVDERIEKYKGKSFIEKYALYMGMVQILELQIKQILYAKFDFKTGKSLKSLEKMTLGQTIECLEKKSVRPDVIILLKHNKDNRNNMAHTFLADSIMSTSLGFSLESIEFRQLDKYIFELENMILFWEWCIKNDTLVPRE